MRTLVTIPISHYCEKARWALDRAGLPYVEERHAPGMHIKAVRRHGGRRRVPILVEDGVLYPDSAAILRRADEALQESARLHGEGPVFAEAARLDQWLNDELGPATRRVVYFHTLSRAHLAIPLITLGVPLREALLTTLAFPKLRSLMRTTLQLTAEEAAIAQATIESTFAQVQSLRADGRRYLAGDRFTAADLSFAALAAPVLLPTNYGAPLPPLRRIPNGPLRSLIERLRKHPAGEFALRLYAEERPPRTPPAK